MGFRLIHRGHEEDFEVRNVEHPESGLVVGLLTHAEPLPGAFDERRVGLDHLSMTVADRAELERWAEHLDASGVTHSGVIDAPFGPTLVFRDPDNIQLELFVHPDRASVEGLLSLD